MKSTRDEEFRHYVRAHRPDLVRTARLLTAGDDHTAEDSTSPRGSRLALDKQQSGAYPSICK
jgi:hypothetical protein